MFVHNQDVIPTPCEPGVERKVLCYDKNLMMCEIHFEKGAQGNFHSHVHEQITYVAKGQFRFTVAGETCVVGQGDSVYMPPNAEHGVTCLEEGILVDVFSPMRETFI